MAKKSKRRVTKKVVSKKSRCSPKAAKSAVRGTKAAGRQRVATLVSPLQAHFEKAGVMFGQTNSKILRKLEGLMGKERCEEWKAFSYRRFHGLETTGNEWDFFHRAAELNTVFSLQSHVTLSVGEWLCEQVRPVATAGTRIGDLGCGGGILAGWLAHQHPHSEVVGFDAVPTLLAAAHETQKAPNLQFMQWDYSNTLLAIHDRFDVLLSCFGIDYPPWRAAIYPETVETLRIGNFYESRKALMRSYFRCWRSAVVDAAKLFCVFRIPSDVEFLAAVDAAHEEGWTFELGDSVKMRVKDEYFPATVFTARQSSQLPEDDLLWHWVGSRTRDQQELGGTEALCVYRSLPRKEVLKEATQTDDDGVLFRGVVGVSGDRCFQFTYGTSGIARLNFFEAAASETTDPWFPPFMPDFDWYGAY